MPRLSRRLLSNVAGVVALLGVLLIAGHVVGADVRRATSPVTAPPGEPADRSPTLPSPQAPVAARVDLGGPVDAVAVGRGAVWAAHDCTVSKVDPKTNRVVATIAGTGPWQACVTGLAVGGGAVWGAVAGVGLARIDPQTNEVVATVPIGPVPASVAVGGGAVWTACCAETSTPGRIMLIRVDPESNRVVARIPLRGSLPAAVGVGPSGVWVVGERLAGQRLWRVDPTTNRVSASVALPDDIGAGGSILVGADVVWLTSWGGNDPMVQVRPRGARVTVRLVEAGSGGLVPVHGVVWSTFAGWLLRVDPDGTHAIPLDVGSTVVNGLAVSPEALWVAAPTGLFRIDPSRLH